MISASIRKTEHELHLQDEVTEDVMEAAEVLLDSIPHEAGKTTTIGGTVMRSKVTATPRFGFSLRDFRLS